MNRASIPTALLLIVLGVWLTTMTLAGDLVGRILSWAQTRDDQAPTEGPPR